MATRLLGKRIITGLLVLLVLVPASISYAKDQEGKGRKVEKFIELAERAKEKTETLINITYANQTALDALGDLRDQLDANVTLFNEAVQNVTNAQLIFQKDPEGAIANVTYALEVFRAVFKSIHVILRDSGVSKGQLIDAQGLLQAMKRALERIDRLEELDLPVETEWLLGNATLYLNITAAIEDLQLGLVNQTAHNLTQANKLISQAHTTLKKKAVELNTKRIESYLKVIDKFYDKLKQQVEKAMKKWPEAEELKDRLADDVDPLIDEANTQFGLEEYSEALASLEKARDMLEEVEQGLKDLRRGK